MSVNIFYSHRHSSITCLDLLIAECDASMQVVDSAQLDLEDEVTFTAGVVALTGACKATSIGLLMSATERSNQRELGQVLHSSSSSLVA